MVEFETIKKIEIIDANTKRQLLNSIEEEAQVTIFGSYKGRLLNDGCFICSSAILVDRNTNHASKFLHADNIALFPQKSPVARGEVRNFTLVFEALPKECKAFDFLEKEEWKKWEDLHGFRVKNIQRNNTDVYNIKFR